MNLDKRWRVRMSNYLFLATILLSVIAPLRFLRHHRIATILAIWSALWFGWGAYLLIRQPRFVRLSDGVFRRRLLTNVMITAAFPALWALAAFYGRIDMAAMASLLYTVGYVLYRVIRSWSQLKFIDWLLPILYVGSATYVVYVDFVQGSVPCGLPFASATLLWVLVLGRRRIYAPGLEGLGAKIQHRIGQLRQLEGDPNSNRRDQRENDVGGNAIVVHCYPGRSQ